MKASSFVWLGLLTLFSPSIEPCFAASEFYDVEIDTNGVAGRSGYVEFLVASPTGLTNLIFIENFSHDGQTSRLIETAGLVDGDLVDNRNPAASTGIYNDNTFLAGLTIRFIEFGSYVSFRLAFEWNYTPSDGNFPDQLAFYVLDENRMPLFSSEDPLDTGSVFAISIDGTIDGFPEVFAPAHLSLPEQLITLELPHCGDGVIDVGEVCDDGNHVPFDGCSLGCEPDCQVQPRTDCRLALSSKLKAKRGSTPSQNLFRWLWAKGDVTLISDYSDPTVDGRYNLCLYPDDDPPIVGAVSTIGWQGLGDAGYSFTDASGSVLGINQIVLRPGGNGRARISVSGRGPNVPYAFLPAIRYSTQLVNLNTGDCWSSSFVNQSGQPNLFKGVERR